MKERKPVAHKERVYGWYPSQNNVYDKQPYSTTYDHELLFKHSTSAYVDKPGAEAVQPPTPVKLTLSPRPPPRSSESSRASQRSGGVSRAKSAVVSRTPSTVILTSPLQQVEEIPDRAVAATQTSPLPGSRQCSPYRRIKSAPPSTSESRAASGGPSRPHTKPWGPSLPATEVGGSPPKVSEAEQEAWVQQLTKEILAEKAEEKKAERIQSASVHRPRASPPPRAIKSAGARRTVAPESYLKRPQNPIPPTVTPAGALSETEEVTLDYDQQLSKYGWRFEVHGDPLRLKKPCLPSRPKFYSTVRVGSLAPEPPRVHMETNDTFFYNTIPRRPLTYTIGKDWISEVIHAKRMELQKREGISYRWKNFSFVY